MSDDRTEDTLRRVLSVEAQQARPAGDGLSRIQQRVDARRARLRWMRPALAGAAAVVIVGGAVGGYAIANNAGGDQTVKIGPAQSGGPTPPALNANGYPTDAIFPFTTVHDEQSWEQQFTQGNSPWVSDPTAVTESWVEHYLMQPGQFAFSAATNGDTSDVTVSRGIGGTDHPVSVVHLVKYDHAWLVIGASDPAGQLAFSAPAAGESVTSPLAVTGPGFGVDERAVVQVRDAMTPTMLGQADTGPFGNGTAQWSASVPFAATSDAGVVVATIASPADGKVGTLAAEKVTFSTSSGHAVSAGAAYGIEGGALVKLDPNTGASEGPVQAANALGTIGEVREYGDSIYFTVKASDCLSTLYSMPTAGGTPTKVATADPGYGIVGFDLSSDGTKLAYFESGCGDKAGSGALVFANLGAGTAHKIQFPSMPPAIIGDPIWEPDGVHVDAFVRTGMQGYLARYDATAQGQGSMTPSTNACSGFDVNSGMPYALAAGPNGALWFATETGSSMQVLSCTGGKPTVEFTVNGNATPQALSINTAGQALLTAESGKVWTWTGTGDATALPNATGVTSATW